MKLIIKEYLSLLKESKELDSLIPELLLAMGHEVISKPQDGAIREYGVDVASIGIDEDGIKKVFLFTIKQGDFGRRDWDDGTPQAVRPSLNEIIDVYIEKLSSENKLLVKKIILSTGGDKKKDVDDNWNRYIKKNSVKNNIEFEFWGGDKLAIFVEEYIFNEYIIPSEQRSLFRKTLALIGDIDYDLSDYYQFLDEILFNNELEKLNDKKILKSLRLIFLSLNIIDFWAENEDNLKKSLYASERTLLNVYQFLNKNNLQNKKHLKEMFNKLYKKHLDIQNKYFRKIYPAIEVKQGLSLYGHDFLQESVVLFEQLGIISLHGNFYHASFYNKGDSSLKYIEYKNIKDAIKLMIKNNKGLLNPVYEEHIIDISLALHLLELWNETKFIDEWIYDLLSHIDFAYQRGSYFPINTNDFEDLVELNIGEAKEKNEYITTSILLPTLAFWCVRLGLVENYKYIVHLSKEMYKKSTLQIWFPDKDTNQFIYTEKACDVSGYVFAPIQIKENISEFAKTIETLVDKKHFINLENNNFPILYLVSSRHFRMPLFPHFFVKEVI